MEYKGNPNNVKSFNIMSIDPIKLLAGRNVVKLISTNNYKIEYKFEELSTKQLC